MVVGGVAVEIVRKKIKNLHLGVYPPHGRVRVAAPLYLSDEAVRLALVQKLGWIKRQRRSFEGQARQSVRDMVNGETHYYAGRRYRLRVREQAGTRGVAVSGDRMELFAPVGSSSEDRAAVLAKWYRDQLRLALNPLIDKWQRKLGVKVAAWGIRKMKTRWGGCNTSVGRVWFNIELAKKPPQCIEYLVIHELAHLIRRLHDDRFIEVMDQAMPRWRHYRKLLNSAPLSDEAWGR